jgi:uncharacterized protein YecT (DUF1311 family)
MKKLIYLAAITTSLVLSGNVLAKKPIDYNNAYGICVNKAGGFNNGVVSGCASETTEKAKKELNALYNKLYKGMAERDADNAKSRLEYADQMGNDAKVEDDAQAEDLGDAKKFELSQKAWLTYRNNYCELEGSYIGPASYEYCPMRLTIERVKELREFGGF